MARSPIKAWTDLVVVNRLSRSGADRVVLTADRGKFWLAGDSPLWPSSDFPVRGRAEVSFWPGHLKGELADWQPAATAILDSRERAMIDDWLGWLNRQLEITPVSLEADLNLEPSRFWQVFDSAWSLFTSRRIPELAGAYFYLKVFDLTGQSFQLTESSNRQPLAGDRFKFNSDQCCFEPAVRGRYSQSHIKLLRYLTAVEPSLVARISAPQKLMADAWNLIKTHPGYIAG